ncbi:MAG: hypothetical protein Q7P63_04740 [Verrucomicrobiota bacterium JB022]|nr:hypothetical protein [Verrucomicrobiota bacterium JB022]
MSDPFWSLIAGAWVGLLFAASFASSTVWLCQLTYSGYVRLALAVLLALTGGTAWAVGLLSAGWLVAWWYAHPLALILGGLATIWLFISALAVRRAPPLTGLVVEVDPEQRRGLVWQALKRPLSFWGTYVFGLGALNLAERHPEPWEFIGWLPAFLGGLLLGQAAWFCFFILLAWLGRSIEPEICLRSLNKLRFLSFVILLGLAVLNLVNFVTYLLGGL